MNTDQKRALAIGGAGIGGLLLWRHFHPSAPAAATGGGGAAGSVAPFVPQSPVVLTSGESVYDPNTEGLTNTPGAVDGGTGSTQTMSPAPQTVTPAGPQYTVNVNYPKPVTKKPTAKKPTKRKPTVKRPTAKSHPKVTKKRLPAHPTTKKKKKVAA